MFPYKTNSPDYLDYIASAMTRDEILASPKFCGLLENELIKDNMEVALRWRAAQYGDYKAKYDFVEYYLCNGPELDADTLLHYRGRAQADPAIMEIAYSYFSDPQVLSEIRETKYGKEKANDWTDCFKNPCFYLGDFSPAMGSMGDDALYKSYWKDMSARFAKALSSSSEQNAEAQAQSIGAQPPPPKPKTNPPPGTITPPVSNPETPGVGIAATSGAHASKVRPSYFSGWAKLGKAIKDNKEEDFNETLEIINGNHTGWLRHLKMDDWFAGAISETLDLIDKANTVRQLGDCYRMWSQVRRLQIYGADNQYGPITHDQLVDNKSADGQTSQPFGNSTPTPADSTKGINAEKAAEFQKVIQQK